jgi:hypothetical protein
MSETPTRIGQRVAMLGEDKRAILSRDLGLTDDQLYDLRKIGVLSENPVLPERR